MQTGSLSLGPAVDVPAAPPAAGTGTRAYIRGSSLLLAGRLISVFLNFAVQVLAVRYLAKADYGAFAYALGVASVASSAILLGLGKGIARLVPLYQEKGDYPRVYGFIALAAGTVLGLGVSLVALVHGFQDALGGVIADPRTLSLLLIVIALAPVDAFDHLLQQLVAVFASPRAIFVRRHVLGPGLKLAAVLGVMATAGSVTLLAYGYVAGGLIGIWLYAAVLIRAWRSEGLLRHLRPRGLVLPARELFGFSIPLLSAELAVLWRSSLTVLVLGYLSTTSEVAEYRAVLSIAGLNLLVAEAFGMLFVPHASRMFARGDRAGISDLYWQTSLWISVLTFPLLALTVVLAEPVTVLLFGERYAGAGILLALLAAGHYVNAALGFNSLALRVHGKLRITVISDVAAAVLVIGACVLLIPRYGALGAALATTGTLVLHNVFNHVGLWMGRTGVRLVDRESLRVHLAIVATVAALLLADRLFRLPIAASLALTIAACLLLVRIARRALKAESTLPELMRIPLVRRLLA